MNKRFVQTMLSIAALAVMAYSQNTATNKSDLLPDEDGGMVRVVLPNAGASLVIGKNATIHGPRQVSVFFGGGWAEEQTRSRQSQLTNLLSDANSGTQQEMAKSGVRGVDSRNALVEDFTNVSATLGDLAIQKQLQTWIASGALQAPKSNTVFVIYLGPGVKSTLRGKVGGQDYLGYYSLVHLDVGNIVYAVVPYEADVNRMRQTATRLVIEAAIDPPAAK
jgi:hypothetical protein